MSSSDSKSAGSNQPTQDNRRIRHRNTRFVVKNSRSNYAAAVHAGLMQTNILERNGKEVFLESRQRVIEFINCSYLGLDLHPEVVKAYTSVPKMWGSNFCCARSRFSIEPLRQLEEELSKHFKGRAITFPSVSTTHLSVLPLLASGVLLNEKSPPNVCLIFDELAHSSMQYLIPILAQEATVEKIAHNDLEQLKTKVCEAKSRGEAPVYVADGVYSMGTVCPVTELLELAEKLDFYLYLDDAHGTSIFGERGEGAVLSQIAGQLPARLFLTFSLSKGFGAAGGGILTSDHLRESIVRTYGQVYSFSAPLDFSCVFAALAALRLHQDGTVKRLQKQLKENVAYFDHLMGLRETFSPIRMIPVGKEHAAISLAQRIMNDGFFLSVAFFPIVARDNAQLRISIAANHTKVQIKALVQAIKRAQGYDVQEFEGVME